MDEPTEQFVNSDPTLSNAGVTNIVSAPSFRNAVPSTSNEPIAAPPLPLRPSMSVTQPNYGMSPYSSYGGLGMGGMNMGIGSYGGYGYGGMGANYGMGSMGTYGAMSGMYNGYNRPMYGDLESRFIQMAEESSRPTFDSIQSLVHAVGSVAMMLENTFFALTSSFRAILGVAENFGRLRSLFAQFWSTFAVLRTFNWLIKKLLVLLGLRTEAEFKAWAEAVTATQNTDTPQQNRPSGWPVILFFGVVAAAPYIILRMLNGLTNSINERLNDPTTWQNPFRAVAQHDFQANSPQEISFSANQVLTVAPQQLQGHLWNSGWLMASADRQHAGLVPVNYIKLIRPTDNKATVEEKKDLKDGGYEEMNKYYEGEL